MSHPTQATSAPRFSIISAVYNVERYLNDYIASIEAQDFPLDRLEVIAVNDGATDGSLQILEEWQQRRPGLVTIVSQPNAGLPAARNAGLSRVTGEWVTFIDPDDTISASYFSEVDKMLRKNPTVQMAAARRMLMFDATGQIEPHPLDMKFTRPARVRNLDENPEFFVGHAPSAFVRADVLRRTGIRFGEKVRPNWEDGHFCVHYLLSLDVPIAAFVTAAKYYYRKRADETSVLSMSRLHPGRYTDVLEHGYLDVMERAVQRYGRVPDWLQTYIIYELSWYFAIEDGFTGAASMAFGPTAEKMFRLMQRLTALLDAEIVESFRLRPFRRQWRDVLMHAYRENPWHSAMALIDKIDTDQRLVRVAYHYVGDRPYEEFFSEGNAVQPAYEKTRSVMYFDRAMLRERIVWLPAGAIRVRCNGRNLQVGFEQPEPPRYTMRLWHIRNNLVPALAPARRQRQRDRLALRISLIDRFVLRVSRAKPVRRLFGDAWTLIDRIENADDSAELLFRYIRTQQRQVNAWFVIRKGVPDDRRLRKDGFKRIVPYGSLRWKLLMLNTKHLISSHADVPIVWPDELSRMLDAPTWRFAFLNHGVIKDDLSRWLDPKDADLFVTSTSDEYESVAGDDSPYRYSARETISSGMPRFDAMLEAGKRVPAEHRDLILLAPTWRNWLVRRHSKPGESTIDMATFERSDFAKNWLALVNSSELKALSEEYQLTIGLLLHPNMQPIRTEIPVPSHVKILAFEGEDVRSTFARSRVLVTDYSSMAFNTAYMERPVVYFQFDRDRVLTGGHLGRRGYFDYHTLGYGPVAESLEGAVTAITQTVEHGPAPMPEYLSRIRAAFPERDGRCTERLFQAIVKSTRRVRVPSAGATVSPQAAESAQHDDVNSAAQPIERAQTFYDF